MSFVEEIKNKKTLAWLIDPDKTNDLQEKTRKFVAKGLKYVFIGGSFVYDYASLKDTLSVLSEFPVTKVLFPGSPLQLIDGVDILLFLSVISSRNPYFLIDAHIQAAPHVELLEKQGTEIVPTGYMVFDSGRQTAVHYITQHRGLPADKPELSVYTALAGNFLGLKVFYLDAGSGANYPIAANIVMEIRKKLPEIPIIVGGGVRNVEKIRELHRAGANLVVVGNALENVESDLFDRL